MHGDCSIRVRGLGFEPEEIANCAARKGLLSIEFDLADSACGCPACQGKALALSLNEIRSTLQQAKDLGARRAIFADAFPSGHRQLQEIITAARTLGLLPEVILSAASVDGDAAKFFHQTGTAIVLRPDSDEGTAAAIEVLRSAGYLDEGAPGLALAREISASNVSDTEAWWRRVRRQGIEPRVQVYRPHRGSNGSKPIDPQRLRALFESLGRIDREEFGQTWELPPALTGRSCKRHLFACHVTGCGTIFACVGVTIALGSIRAEPLRDILETSEVLENTRDFEQKVKEPCGSCCKTVDCYGCRGSAYQLTGDYLTGDALCWKASGVEIESLPISVSGLLPHGKTIRVIDQLIQVGERESRLTYTIAPGSTLVDEQGRLDESAYVEMMAQAFAASHGFHLSRQERSVHNGLLLGVKDLKIFGQARIGDVLTVHLRKVTRFGAFGVVEGEVFRQDGTRLAGGQIKIWRNTGQQIEAMML